MTTPAPPTPTGPLPPRTRHRAAKPKRSRPVLKAFLWFLFIIFLFVAGYLVYLYYKIDAAIDTIGAPPAPPAVEPSRQPVKSAKSSSLTVLLLGKDTRQETGSLNTDVIMVAALNPSTQSATVISIPRDTLVKVNGYRTGKANSFYANFYVSDKAKAYANTKNLFSKYLGTTIDYMSIVDFQGFVDIVDNLGGLDIDVDINMCYKDNSDGTNIRLSRGQQHLNGEKALDFVRYRQSNCNPPTAESGDLERNKRQQQVLRQMIGQVKLPSMLTKLGPMIESVGKNVQTDIPSAQIRQMLQTYLGIDRDKIDYIHLEGTWQSPYIIVEPDVLKNAQDALKRQVSG